MKCPKCGYVYSDSDNFCKQCGTPKPIVKKEEVPVPTAVEPRKKFPIYKIFSILFLSLSVLFVLMSFVVFYGIAFMSRAFALGALLSLGFVTIAIVLLVVGAVSKKVNKQFMIVNFMAALVSLVISMFCTAYFVHYVRIPHDVFVFSFLSLAIISFVVFLVLAISGLFGLFLFQKKPGVFRGILITGLALLFLSLALSLIFLVIQRNANFSNISPALTYIILFVILQLSSAGVSCFLMDRDDKIKSI